LYFMLGLPTETDDDIIAIVELASEILHEWKVYTKNKSRGVRLTVSTSCFIPKPHTPFQWEAQISIDEYLRRVDILRSNIKTIANAKAITYNWHSPEQGYIEAALTRGDRRLGKVIKTAWENGARLDSWSECFSLDTWLYAFEQNNLDVDFYATRERSRDEKLPWNFITSGVKEEHLWRERESAYKNEITPDCRSNCSDCGMSDDFTGTKCYG